MSDILMCPKKNPPIIPSVGSSHVVNNRPETLQNQGPVPIRVDKPAMFETAEH